MKILLIIYLITIAIYLIGFIYLSQVFAQAASEGQKLKTWHGPRFTAYLYLVLVGAVPLLNCYCGLYFLAYAQKLVQDNLEEK